MTNGTKRLKEKIRFSTIFCGFVTPLNLARQFLLNLSGKTAYEGSSKSRNPETMTSHSKLRQSPDDKTVNVRSVARADLPRLIEIASHSETASHWNPAEYQKLLTQETGASETGQKRTTLVVERDSQIAGFMIGRQVGEEWEIENIAVTGSAQRSGLGTSLLNEFLQLVYARGGQTVFLEVRESNSAARALYRKLGFVEAGRRQQYYENPPEDALILKFNFSQDPAFPLNQP